MVTLVGAGPGDPELLTLKGLRCLEAADVVVYDDLVHPALLGHAPAGAERVFAGKRGGGCHTDQGWINNTLIERGRRGVNVVRLKGGDPFIFGRGGEEIEALEAAGVPWMVVPGVSAGTGAPAAAGIALTRRGVSSSVRFVSGHADLAGAAPGKETLVIFMGLARLEATVSTLLQQGWSAATPAAIIENGTLPSQRVTRAALGNLAAAAREAGVRSPALIVMGEVLHPRRPQAGVIVMAHGSPLPEWHASVERLSAQLTAAGHRAFAAFLPPSQPSLADAVAAARAAGLRELVIVPYFLAAGLHVSRDLPALVAELRQQFPDLRLELTACLDGHAGLLQAVEARANAGLRQIAQHSMTCT